MCDGAGTFEMSSSWGDGRDETGEWLATSMRAGERATERTAHCHGLVSIATDHRRCIAPAPIRWRSCALCFKPDGDGNRRTRGHPQHRPAAALRATRSWSQGERNRRAFTSRVPF